MNAIEYLIRRIKREIPISLLNTVLLRPDNTYPGVPITLDFKIQQEILNDIVITDMNVIAGKEETIDVSRCKISTVKSGTIIHIGYGPTGGKEIMSILDVGYGFGMAFNGKPTIVSAVSEPLITGTGRVQLVGKNTAYMEGNMTIPMATMRVVLEHDKYLNDLNPRVLIYLAELAILATKMHLYTQGMILLKNAVIRNGEDLPYLESILEGYADSSSMYNEKLKDYQAIAFMTDKTAYANYLRGLCPS